MEKQMMTDEEIEKALQEISTSETLKRMSSIDIIAKKALDYINRLKERIDNMYEENQNLQTYINNHEEIWKRNAEIDKAIVRKETAKEVAKEILKDIKANLPQGYIGLCLWIIGQAEKYGVEVDDEANN